MQQCPHCGTPQMNGTIFCADCGGSLLVTAMRKETTASLGQHLKGLDLPVQPTVVPAPTPPSTAGYTIRLVVLNSGRRLTFDVSEELLVGRKDNAKGIFPDIDLALDGGYDAGVSRRHAVLAFQNNICVVQDLDSANGTFINGQRIPPHVPTPIRHGDELKFGTLLLRFELGSN